MNFEEVSLALRKVNKENNFTHLNFLRVKESKSLGMQDLNQFNLKFSQSTLGSKIEKRIASYLV